MTDPVQHQQYSADEQAAICGKTAAVIIAGDWNTTPLTVTFDDPEQKPYVCDGRDGDKDAEPVVLPRPLQVYEGASLLEGAVQLAIGSKFASVDVLLCAAGEHEVAARKAVGENAAVTLLSKEELDAARTAACNFELSRVPAVALNHAKALLESNQELGSVMFISCDQPRMTPWHLAQLCIRMNEQPQLHIVNSWIYWLSRLPRLVSRGFFEIVKEQELMAPRQGSAFRPLPQFEVSEVVFGEEKLHANESSSENRDSFFKGAPFSALQAVRLARKLQDADEEEAEKLTSGLGESSAQLLKVAQEVIQHLDAAVDEDELWELTSWDQWAQRNKKDFALLNDHEHRDSLVYVDSAATSQRLSQAVQAEADFNNHENANIYRGCYKLSGNSTKFYNQARAVIGQHLNTQPRQVAFTGNTTTSANIVAQSWAYRNLNEGDLVLITISEHHSNMMPWRMAADARGAEVAYIPLQGDGRIDMAAYRELLARGPRLVCVAQISNVLGLENPVKEMAAMAHEVGARFFVDAAQSFPHLAIDVEDLGCDFLAFSGHKVYGPLGIGGLYFSEEVFDEMDPIAVGGGVISHVGKDSYYLRVAAIQYEPGTPPIAQAVGMAAAVDHVDLLGMDAVQEHGAALTKYLLAGLEQFEGVTVWGDHSCREGVTGLVTFNLEGVSSARLATDLGALDVCIRAGGQCALPLHASMGVDGTGRVSFGIHNTAEDVEATLVAIAMSSIVSAGRKPFTVQE